MPHKIRRLMLAIIIATSVCLGIMVVLAAFAWIIQSVGVDPHSLRAIVFALLFFYITVDAYFVLSREDEDCDCADKS